MGLITRTIDGVTYTGTAEAIEALETSEVDPQVTAYFDALGVWTRHEEACNVCSTGRELCAAGRVLYYKKEGCLRGIAGV